MRLDPDVSWRAERVGSHAKRTMVITRTLRTCHYSKTHKRDVLGDDELGLGGRDHVLRCHTRRWLDQWAVFGESNHCELIDNQIDLSQRGERQGAFLDDLRLAVGSVLHGHEDALRSRHKIHRPRPSPAPSAGDHPVRKMSLRVHLQAAQHGHVEVPAANQAEGHGAVKGTCARQRAHRVPGRVGERPVQPCPPREWDRCRSLRSPTERIG